MARNRASYTITTDSAGAAASVITAAAMQSMHPEIGILPLVASSVVAAGSAAWGAHHLWSYFETARIPTLPAIDRIDKQLRWLGTSDQILLNKLSRDFDMSPLSTRLRTIQAQRDMVMRARHIGVPATFITQLERAAEAMPANLAFANPTGEAADLRRLRNRSEPISVLCLSLHPAILATLIDMRDRLQIPLDIYDAANGVLAIDRMMTAIRAGMPFDIVLLPSPVFLLAPRELIDEYAFALPVYAQGQHLVRRKWRGAASPLHGIDDVLFLEQSSAVESIRMLHGRGSFRLRENPYSSGTRLDITHLRDNEVAMLWSPLDRLALAHRNIMSAGRFRYWIGLTISRRLFDSDRDRRALVSSFLVSWSYCANRNDYAAGLIFREAGVRSRFREAMAEQIGNGGESLH